MKYEVKEGDSLWSISEELLRTGSNWKKIYSYNYHIIGDDPDLIEVGQVLEIPKHKSYRTCLAKECDVLLYKVENGERDKYLSRLFHAQDELMMVEIVSIVMIFVLALVSLVVFKIFN